MDSMENFACARMMRGARLVAVVVLCGCASQGASASSDGGSAAGGGLAAGGTGAAPASGGSGGVGVDAGGRGGAAGGAGAVSDAGIRRRTGHAGAGHVSYAFNNLSATTGHGIVDQNGDPLLLDAAAATDSDDDGKKELYATVGATRYRFVELQSKMVFGSPTPLVDNSGTPVVPKVLFEGRLAASDPLALIAVTGATARRYDFALQSFQTSVALVDLVGKPFVPRHVTYVELANGPMVVAVREDSHKLHAWNGAAFVEHDALFTCAGWALSPVGGIAAAPFFSAKLAIADEFPGDIWAWDDNGGCAKYLINVPSNEFEFAVGFELSPDVSFLLFGN